MSDTTLTRPEYVRPAHWDRPDEWANDPDPEPIQIVVPKAIEPMSEEDCYLATIVQDRSGLDLAEFAFVDETKEDGCYRAYPYQVAWWRDRSPRSVDQGARSIGKSEKIKVQACQFPFGFPGQEFVIVAPEGTHIDAITDRIEAQLTSSRLMGEMMVKSRSGIKHKPFVATFQNGARVYARLPQRSGVGVKGCLAAGAMVLTRSGVQPIETVQVGDEVWSHENRWTRVLETESFEDDDVYEVKGQGSYPLVANGRHRVWGRWDVSRQPGKTAKLLGPLTWSYVDDLADEDRINFHWAGPGRGAFDHLATAVDVPGLDGQDPASWWLIGRWIADGYTTSQKLKGGGRGRRRVHWVATPAQWPEITSRLAAQGLHHRVVEREHSSADVVEHSSGALADWLETEFGKGAAGKRLPGFVFTLPAEHRAALLAGYQSGDGAFGRADRIVTGSASKALTVGIGIVAQSLGHPISFMASTPRQTHVMGVELKVPAQPCWKVSTSVSRKARGVNRGGYISYKIKTIKPTNPVMVHNLVTEDSSYLADGIFHHNCHPVVLHVDEGQDVSEQTWMELPEVVRWEVEGAMWQVHGVSKGVQGDAFYRMTQPGSGFTVHRITALHRPSWNAEERAQKVKEYGGSVDSPDYKRNVHGDHGAAMNRLFVLARLFACVDTMEGSEYNSQEYHFSDISADALVARVTQSTGVDASVDASSEEMAAMMRTMLDFPAMHTAKYDTFWVGMDVGVIGDPSEILIFAEYVPDKAERQRNRNAKIAVPDAGMSRFKLVTRVKLRLIPLPLQAQTVMHIINFYKPKAFALDKTGLGIGLFQELRKIAGGRFVINEDAGENPVTPETQAAAEAAITAIKGYNFSEKLVISIDEKKADELGLGSDLKEILDKASDRQIAKDRATDVLREYVDTRRLMLPYDQDVINQMNGQTWSASQEPIDKYGRRRSTYSIGTFHITDAARCFALGESQRAIEALFAETRRPAAPVIAQFGL